MAYEFTTRDAETIGRWMAAVEHGLNMIAIGIFALVIAVVGLIFTVSVI